MLTITPKADKFIVESGIETIRFGVRPNKGCAGYEYIWEKGEIKLGDYRIKVNDRYTLLIAGDQKKYLDQCEIDLIEVDEGIGQKIQFNNSKTKDVCGCGESLDFPKEIYEDPAEVWEPKMNFRFFHEYNNPWTEGEEEQTLNFGGIDISHHLDDAITIKPKPSEVKKYDPSSSNDLSKKYRDWRK